VFHCLIKLLILSAFAVSASVCNIFCMKFCLQCLILCCCCFYFFSSFISPLDTYRNQFILLLLPLLLLLLLLLWLIVQGTETNAVLFTVLYRVGVRACVRARTVVPCYSRFGVFYFGSN
jgi:hypothetical protein